MITSETYLLHVSRYIHLNPAKWHSYKYSSLSLYLEQNVPDWLSANRILGLYGSKEEYVKFLEGYEKECDELALLKHELANLG